MRYIRTYESFDMNKTTCDRCGNSTRGMTTMSIFNTDIICMDCKKEEKLDPEYKAAVEAEAEAVRQGVRNYPGAFPNYKPIPKD